MPPESEARPKFTIQPPPRPEPREISPSAALLDAQSILLPTGANGKFFGLVPKHIIYLCYNDTSDWN